MTLSPISRITGCYGDRFYPTVLRTIVVSLVLLCMTVTSVSSHPSSYSHSHPHTPPKAFLIMDAATGRTLHVHNADTLIYPASLTKMMTLYMVFDALKQGRLTLRTRLRVSRNAARRPASRLGLRHGSTITVEQAIQALIVRSANDVAVVVAEAIGRTEAHFARMMTIKARSLGMGRTTFHNASGLYHRRQVTTARDMALLARTLIYDWTEYFPYFSQRTFRYHQQTYNATNRLLNTYEGMDGLKTGYIKAAGYHLVATAQRNGHRLISVMMGKSSSRARNQHTTELLDRSFEQVARKRSAMIASIGLELLALPRPARQPRVSPAVVLSSRRTQEIIQQSIEAIIQQNNDQPQLTSSDKTNRTTIIATILLEARPKSNPRN